jgi:hypothetical protein
MPNGYENPAYSGTGGDQSRPKSAGGSKGGAYDNAPNSTKAKTDGEKAKPAGHSAPSSGYDNVGKDGDFSFKGTPKKRSPNI